MKGIDISVYQGSVIDFAKVKATGVEIVYIKATEGLTYDSAHFKLQYAQAAAQDLKIGFYHYLRGNDPVAEAKHFLKATNGLSVDCKYVIDIEQTDGQTVAKVSENVRKFADYMISQGKEVAIYTGDYFYKDNLNSTIKDITLWVAHYGIVKPFAPKYVGFQYSSTGNVDGILGCVDLNIFDEGIFIKEKINNIILTAKPVSSVAIKEIVKYGTVTASTLNVRSNSNIDSTVIGQLKNGAKVRLGNKVGDWYNIYFGDHGGWVSANYINDGATVVKAATKTSGIVTASVLNVRSQANATSSIVGNLKKGDSVKIGLISNRWASIYFGAHGGWVSMDFIK